MKDDKVFLKHILDEIDFLLKETADLKFEEFIENNLLKRASARSIEIIGEGVKNLSKDFREKHKGIEWKKFAGIRDKVIHCYFGVNWDIVWAVIKTKLPELRDKIENILEETEEVR